MQSSSLVMSHQMPALQCISTTGAVLDTLNVHEQWSRVIYTVFFFTGMWHEWILYSVRCDMEQHLMNGYGVNIRNHARFSALSISSGVYYV